MSDLDRAAWIPADVCDRDWNHAVNRAVDWVEQECLRQGAGAMLVTNAPDGAAYSPAIAAFGRRHRQTTPRSGWDHRLDGATGPVLAFVPTPEALDHAMTLARGSSLAVVESRSYPLRGWADELGALDLTHPAPPAGRERRLAQALNSLVLYGTRAYAPPTDQRHAQHVLDDLAGDGLLDRDTLLGALAARGITTYGLAQIGALVDATR